MFHAFWSLSPLSFILFQHSPLPSSQAVWVFHTQKKYQNSSLVLCLANSAASGVCRITKAYFSAQETGKIYSHTFEWSLCLWFSYLAINKVLSFNPYYSKPLHRWAVLACPTPELVRNAKCEPPLQTYPIRLHSHKIPNDSHTHWSLRNSTPQPDGAIHIPNDAAEMWGRKQIKTELPSLQPLETAYPIRRWIALALRLEICQATDFSLRNLDPQLWVVDLLDGTITDSNTLTLKRCFQLVLYGKMTLNWPWPSKHLILTNTKVALTVSIAHTFLWYWFYGNYFRIQMMSKTDRDANYVLSS